MIARVIVQDSPENRVAEFRVHVIGDLIRNSHKQVTEPRILT
jgi:hypothetical protein